MSADELEVLRAVTANTPESIAVYDLEGRVVYVNPATERIFGDKPFEELRGKLLFDELFPAARGNPFHQAFLRVAAGGPPETFDHYYAPFDTWFANRVVRVGDRVHVLGRDVTDDVRRKRRLETLARISEIVTDDATDFQGATSGVVRVLADVMGADVSIALLSADEAWLELAAAATADGAPSVLARDMKRWRPEGHVAEALRTRRAVLADAAAVSEAERHVEQAEMQRLVATYRPSSVLVVPLLAGDTSIGVLIASTHGTERPLTSEYRLLATEIAPSLALYLAHARRRDEASSLRDRLAALADAIPALVAFVDREQRYQYVNATYESWFAQPRGTFLGREMRDVMPAGAYERVEAHVATVLAGKAVRFRTQVHYPTGARDVDIQYLPIGNPNGSLDGFAVLVADVTAETRVADLERRERIAEKRATRTIESLLELTAKLATAGRADEIARVLVDESVDALDAKMCGLFVMAEPRGHERDEREREQGGGELVLLRERGYRPEHATAFARTSAAPGTPIGDCVLRAETVWITSRAEYAARYPEFERAHRPEGSPELAFALLPLVIEGRVSACLSVVFHDAHPLRPETRPYLEALASHGAEALRRARLYADLREASETREAMIQGSPTAIVLLDGSGIVHAWNPAAERMFGWTAEEILGRSLPTAGAAPGEPLVDVESVARGAIVEGQELRRQRRNGEWFDVELYAAPVTRSDGTKRVLAIMVDVSSRKRVERDRQLVGDAAKALARSLAWQETIGDVLRLVVADLATFCCIDLVTDASNTTLLRVALTRDDEPAATPMPRTIALERGRGGVSEAIRTREPVLLRDVDDATLRGLARDEAHLEAMRALAMRSGLTVPLLVGDRVLGALSLASRERNFDELDVGIASELAARIATTIDNARLFEDAKAARREAEAANRTKDEFLAILGHELRNPLAPMVTALELMKLRAPDQLERERAVVERQVQHLSRLVDDLLDVSRITRGKVELRRQDTPIAEPVAKAVELTSQLFERAEHRLTVDVPRDLVINGDVMRLAQIVSNLLANAAKYTPRGGTIEVRATRSGGDVLLSVTDDGAGIPDDLLPRVFDIFVQAPQSRARTDGGLGLGLTIVKNLVELHGGTVTAESEGPGKGTTMRVRLPLAAAPSADVQKPAPTPRPRAKAMRRILVVDDNEDAAELLSELLGTTGHETRIAYDGLSALRIADEFRPDVAVLDIGLPVMDGYEVAERLRASALHKAVKLIAVTGYGQESDKERARQAGFDAHLAKPVPLGALVRLVEGA